MQYSRTSRAYYIMIDDITPYWLGTARALREPGQSCARQRPLGRSFVQQVPVRFSLSLSLSGAGQLFFFPFEMSFTHVSYIQTTTKRSGGGF